jgi:hypothetical protein
MHDDITMLPQLANLTDSKVCVSTTSLEIMQVVSIMKKMGHRSDRTRLRGNLNF